MIHIIKTKASGLDEAVRLNVGVPLHIKVPSRRTDNQPLLGFCSSSLGNSYMQLKNLSQKDYEVVPAHSGLADEYLDLPVLVFENEKQILDMEEDSEKYDYESLILSNTL